MRSGPISSGGRGKLRLKMSQSKKHCSRTAAKEQLENPTLVTCRHCFDPRLINSAEAARFPRWIMSLTADPRIGAWASATLRPLSAGFPQDTESQDRRNWFAVLWITWCNNNAGQLAEQQEQQPALFVCLIILFSVRIRFTVALQFNYSPHYF